MHKSIKHNNNHMNLNPLILPEPSDEELELIEEEIEQLINKN